MAILGHTLLALSLVALVLCYPNPPTCYTKVLSMARDLTHQAAMIKMEPETNACIMPKMRQYVFLVDGLRELRCAYTRKVRVVGLEVRQLHMIMSQRCHGELVFTTDDCAALDRPPMSWSRK
nr:cytokine-like protein 1 isoform X2 [Oncorhynchus nerka]